MPEQLPLPLPWRPALGRGDFFVAPSNAVALAQIDAWRGWPGGKLALTGPEGAGKTHLAHVWAADSGATLIAGAALAAADLPALAAGGAVAVDDAAAVSGDRAAETALFHLHNLLAAAGGRLLVTGREPPARWPIALPDLASRLAAAGIARLDLPDDALITAVLAKLFADRQLAVAPALVPWLAQRCERSLAAAGRLVAQLDAAALASGRPITRALAQPFLSED
jgi:chromosomal replication initiation ATPase DnaA